MVECVHRFRVVERLSKRKVLVRCVLCGKELVRTSNHGKRSYEDL